jgi:hypothetical protein
VSASDNEMCMPVILMPLIIFAMVLIDLPQEKTGLQIAAGGRIKSKECNLR